jgi:Undecaprenyl-phosphate galactose phosphotransferase WbaP
MSKRLMVQGLPVGRRSVLAVVTQPWLCRFLLVAVDAFVVAAANIAAVGLKARLDTGFPIDLYLNLWPLLIGFIVSFAALRLYSLVSLGPADELRRIVGGCSIVYLIAAAATFLIKVGPTYSRGAFLIAWALSVLCVPLARAGLRALVSRTSWWGMPVVVLGAGLTGRMLVKHLLTTPQLGLKPVAMLDDDPNKHGEWMGVPIPGGLDLAPSMAKDLRIAHAVLAMPGAPVERLRVLELRNQDVFPHLIIIPNLCGFASLWVTARDLGGFLGLEVRRNLLLAGPRMLKRSLDLGLCVLGAIVAVPVIAALAILIKLESRGPIFYGQSRVGRDGRTFTAWKFRSMVRDADARLKDYLELHPELREEWERDHKLRNDPRVTRVGRLLRKTSLDELPQVWNVLTGEMSLIGPRPIVEAEVERYRDMIALYQQVRPGISGLWQVSGRNDTTYEERVALDSYYVRNWSVWLDLYILAKTLRVVLLGRGAY